MAWTSSLQRKNVSWLSSCGLIWHMEWEEVDPDHSLTVFNTTGGFTIKLLLQGINVKKKWLLIRFLLHHYLSLFKRFLYYIFVTNITTISSSVLWISCRAWIEQRERKEVLNTFPELDSQSRAVIILFLDSCLGLIILCLDQFHLFILCHHHWTASSHILLWMLSLCCCFCVFRDKW